MNRRDKLQDDLKFTYQKSDPFDESEQNSRNKKKKKKEDKVDKYQCGNSGCNKIYHSYTAFYNHCKKAHNGQLPQNSLVNGKIFAGPSKHRGRPRITKADAKNPQQIEAMKSQNELIQFLGTIDSDKQQKKQDVIVSVQDAVQQMNKSIQLVKSWGLDDLQWIDRIKKVNESISAYDLPQFYDPIEYDKFTDQVDTYNFLSIMKFLEKNGNRQKCLIQKVDEQIVKIVTIVWLARMMSVNLLGQVIYVLAQQRQNKQNIIEKDYFIGKSKRFLDVIGRFLKCYDHSNIKQEKSC